MVAAQPNEQPPIEPGSLWACVSARGQGQPIRIVRVGATNVFYRVVGRGADQSQQFKLPIGLLRARYTPLGQPVIDRQRQLRIDQTRGIVPILDGVTVSDDDKVDPIDEAIEAANAVITSGQDIESRRPIHGGSLSKLTADQVREIYQLAVNGEPVANIAAAYDVSASTVGKIKIGMTYAWATQDLRQAQASPATPSVPEAPQEEPIVAAPQLVRPAHPSEQTDPVARLNNEATTLLTDMADALETLGAYAGKTLPRFVRLDLNEVVNLVAKARSLT